MISGVNCLITGGAGFIGAALARNLLDSGAHVFALSRPTDDPWRLKGAAVEMLPVDLLDPESLKRAVAGCRPEIVYHLAAHGGYPFQKDAHKILETNLLGTYHLLEACMDSPCRLFVNTGSSSEYGYKKAPMRETDLLEPNSFYAVGKAAATHLCAFAATRLKFKIATFRLFSVFGPWEEPTRLVPTIIRRALKNEPLELVPPGTARDFIYLDDVLEAFKCIDRLLESNGDVFNIGSGIQSSVGEAVKTVMELTGSKSELKWQMPPREWDATCWVASIDKVRQRLGWQPRHTLREGLEKTIRWMKEHA